MNVNAKSSKKGDRKSKYPYYFSGDTLNINFYLCILCILMYFFFSSLLQCTLHMVTKQLYEVLCATKQKLEKCDKLEGKFQILSLLLWLVRNIWSQLQKCQSYVFQVWKVQSYTKLEKNRLNKINYDEIIRAS